MAFQMSGKKERKELWGFSADAAEEKWLKHYSSHHQILLVGDGDFSFSLCLAQSFGLAFNILATSLDTHDEVVRKYKKAKSNLVALTKLGADVWHGVDATQMKFHPFLKMRRFDRIIFNFPHAGFHGREDNLSLIQKHQKLVHGFFMNARSMLRPNGEIHVNHKTTPPFDEWRIRELGIQSSLWLIECVEFKKQDYRGYNNKRGAGCRCDEPFHLGECRTFKFALLTKNESSPRSRRILSSNHHYPLGILSPHSPPGISCRNGHLPIYGRREEEEEEPVLSCKDHCCLILRNQVSGYVHHGYSSELQRSSSWPESTEFFRYPRTEHVTGKICL